MIRRAAAVPVSTKIPVPMIEPMPNAVRLTTESVRFSCCVDSACADNSATVLVANSPLALDARAMDHLG
jgi:hypothetical protein